jgi:hypothetical protein
MVEPARQITDNKGRLELEKLQAEIDNLKRPWWQNPTFWVAVATTLIAFFGVVVQYVRSSNEYQLAEIGRQRALLETERAERLQEKYRSENGTLQVENAKLERERTQLQGQRTQLLNQIVQAREQLQQIPASSAQATSRGELLAQAEETAGSLQALEEAVKQSAPSLPAFAVVASFQSVQRAEEYARTLTSKDHTYKVEVFRREPHRYAVTLGGYLSYEEANRRVLYAKERGLAEDAYVRLAKSWGHAVATFPEE